MDVLGASVLQEIQTLIIVNSDLVSAVVEILVGKGYIQRLVYHRRWRCGRNRGNTCTGSRRYTFVEKKTLVA